MKDFFIALGGLAAFCLFGQFIQFIKKRNLQENPFYELERQIEREEKQKELKRLPGLAAR